MAFAIPDKVLFLSEVGRILSSSLDYSLTLAMLGRLVVTNIADFCIIDVIEGSSTKRLSIAVSDPKKLKIAEKFYHLPPSPKNKGAIYDAARLGKPFLVKNITNKWLKSVTPTKEEFELNKILGLKTIVFAPLKSRDTVIGVLTIGSWQEGFHYQDSDVRFIEALAGRAGLAVDNARLFSEAQEAIRSRDEFLSIASHELKTPLTSILLNLQRIQLKIKKARDQQIDFKELDRLLELNIQQSRRMSKLINDLLNTSVISAGRLQVEREKVDLKLLAEMVIAQFDAETKKKGIEIIFKDKEKIIGSWDRVRLGQVVSNLISNAIKYGGNKPIKVSLKRADGVALLKVEDSGIGIEKVNQAQVFERFQRAVSDKEYQGIGVGLYISRQIIEAHGGSLNVESEIGKGSTFTVELPL